MREPKIGPRALWRPLAAKTSLAIVWLVALGLVAICGGILLEWRSTESRQADETAATAVSVVAQNVARNFELFDLTLQAVSNGLRMPGIWELSPQMRNLALFNRATDAHYLGFLNALDENGNVVANSQPAPYESNWASRDYFAHHRSDKSPDIFISKPFSLGTANLASIAISRRLSHPDGTFAGVVVGSMNLAYFQDLFSKLALGPHGSIALLRDDGVVLMRLPFALNNIGNVIDGDSWFSKALQSGAARAVAMDPIDKIQRDYSFKKIGSLPLVVSVGLASEDIHAGSTLYAMMLMPTAVVCLLLTVWMTIDLRRQWDSRELEVARLQRANDDFEGLAAKRARERDAARRASDDKLHFLAELSHEMRAPLNGIVGYAQLLRAEDGADATRSQRLEVMLSAGGHLRDLLNRAHDYSRLNARAPEPNMQRIDLPDLLAQCYAIIEPGAANRGLQVRPMMSLNVPRYFVTDATHLRQVLLNLLSNAVKFTRTGWVELRTSGDPGRLRIEVADTGPGIPSDQQVQLFRQRQESDVPTTTGSGSGLQIATQLIHGMGGEIGYRDNPGGGSVFWLDLPEGVEREVTATPAEATTETPRRSLRVLVADDLASNREIAAAFLRDAGHEVVQVSDGREAIEEVAASEFHVVLMDLRMPGMKGLDAAREIRALRGTRGHVPIIALTGDVGAEDVEKCLRAGMNGHLKKPLDRAELLAAVHAAAGVPVTAAGAASGEPKPSADNAAPADAPVLDHGMLAELSSCISADDLNRHLRSLGIRIEVLLGHLSNPGGFANAEELADTLHGLAGSAGTLGFSRLSVEARQFESAFERDPWQAVTRADRLASVARDTMVEVIGVTEPPAAMGAQRR